MNRYGKKNRKDQKFFSSKFSRKDNTKSGKNDIFEGKSQTRKVFPEELPEKRDSKE